ncbi:unnamed protein product [Calypogeia fissa]
MGKGKSEYCNFCLELYRSTIDPYWGTSNRIVEIKGCNNCVGRHAAEVYKMNTDFEQKKQHYESELSNSARILLTTKKEYDELLSALKLSSRNEGNQLQADNKKQRSMVKFLQVVRDSMQADVMLEVPGLQLSAHGTILAARSAVFHKMVESATTTAENLPRVIKVDDHISPPVLEAVVDFCYSGEFTFSELVPADEVLTVAHTFELGSLKELCEVELCRGLTVDNVPHMLKLSRKFSAHRLQEAAGKVFHDNFDTLKSKVYEVLEAPSGDMKANSISDLSCSGLLDSEEWVDT